MARTCMPIQENDVVTQARPFVYRKAERDLLRRHRESHQISRALERLGSASVRQLADETGLPVGRIISHLDWMLGLKEPKVSIAQRQYRGMRSSGGGRAWTSLHS